MSINYRSSKNFDIGKYILDKDTRWFIKKEYVIDIHHQCENNFTEILNKHAPVKTRKLCRKKKQLSCTNRELCKIIHKKKPKFKKMGNTSKTTERGNQNKNEFDQTIFFRKMYRWHKKYRLLVYCQNMVSKNC